MLTQEMKNLWIKELRSGKYIQAFGNQNCNKTGKHCALDVLWVIIKANSMKYLSTRDDYLSNSQINDIIMLNDRESKSLSEIADYIEKNVKAKKVKLS